MQVQLLREINADNIEHRPFPLSEILEGSLYYPGSGIDGTPIRNWSLGVNSFVYVDLSWTQESYLRALSEQPVYGYHIVAQRHVKQQELPQQLLWEHAADQEPSLHEPWSRHYSLKIQGPLKRDEEKRFAVTLFGIGDDAKAHRSA